MPRIKVYFIIPDLAAGGAERVSITLARILSKEGYDIEFVNIGNPDGEMLQWIEPEFKMTSLGFKHVLSSFFLLKAFMDNHPGALFFSSREHVNVIGLLCASLAKREMIVRIPNMPKNKLERGIPGIKAFVLKSINKFLLKKAKWVIAQNAEMREQLLDMYHLHDDQVVAINNPVDKDYVVASAENIPSPYSGNGVVFLSAGTIDYRKGFDILEEAWTTVKEAIPNAQMFILGRATSEYAKGLVQNAHRLKDFSFLGFQSNPYPYMKHCDCFVLPSRMEGFPNVVLEAMCFNRPVASTTCVSIIKDIITPGENGYYCEIENPDSLASIMIKAVGIKQVNNNYCLFEKDKLLEIFQ